jgi:DNA helicase-2/ATP-dependent DNA helicase PcrA
MNNSEADVVLTTAHESKGKEWDNVYIWNDSKGVFPNTGGYRNLTSEEYEEERRIHYIAWTRAKEKLVIYTSDKKGAFLEECKVK